MNGDFNQKKDLNQKKDSTQKKNVTQALVDMPTRFPLWPRQFSPPEGSSAQKRTKGSLSSWIVGSWNQAIASRCLQTGSSQK